MYMRGLTEQLGDWPVLEENELRLHESPVQVLNQQAKRKLTAACLCGVIDKKNLNRFRLRPLFALCVASSDARILQIMATNTFSSLRSSARVSTAETL